MIKSATRAGRARRLKNATSATHHRAIQPAAIKKPASQAGSTGRISLNRFSLAGHADSPRKPPSISIRRLAMRATLRFQMVVMRSKPASGLPNTATRRPQ